MSHHLQSAISHFPSMIVLPPFALQWFGLKTKPLIIKPLSRCESEGRSASTTLDCSNVESSLRLQVSHEVGVSIVLFANLRLTFFIF